MKSVYIALFIMICVYFAACGAATFTPQPKEPVSSSIPDLESVVEPMEAPPQTRDAEKNRSAELDGEKIEYGLLRLINMERAAAGADALGIEETMRFAARIRAEETLAAFSHTRPNGTPYNTAFDEAGFSYAGKWHGENIASLRFEDGPLDEETVSAAIFNELKSSPGHYQNMVSENFLQSGVGAVLTDRNGHVEVTVVQLFSSI